MEKKLSELGLGEKRVITEILGQSSVRRLNQLKSGEQGIVVAVEGGRRFRQRLSLRGISEGSVVRMIYSRYGPITVDVDRSIVCMGRGMAQKVRVRRV